MRRFLRVTTTLFFFALGYVPAAYGQGATETLRTKPGVPVLVASAKCLYEPVKNSGTSLTKDANGMMRLVFTPDPLLRENAVIYLEQGDAVDADGIHCANAVAKRYVVELRAAQEVPPDTLETAFRVLVSALVIAILLESAFELLFNWRLFQAFFVGKAWRTPIMFAISLLVSRQFDIDILGPLFDAYRGLPAGSSGSGWLTSILTAMILAGGSVGVHRIMTKLGIRSPFPKAEQEQGALNQTEAYVSITVRARNTDGSYAVNLSEQALNTSLPAMLGVVGPDQPVSPASLLFPAKWRIPRSGGLKVAVDKSYLVSVTDTRTNKVYDITGTEITNQSAITPIRFAPRAFVDLVIVIK